MEGDEMASGMPNGKSIGANGRLEHQPLRRKARHNVARASRDVINLALTGGASPPRKRASSRKSPKCRIRVIGVSCAEASDAIRRLERIAALLIGKVGSDG